MFARRYFEMCIFSYISSEFKTGDIYAEGSEEYTDYRTQLLTWDECEPLLDDYCREINFSTNKQDFIDNLKSMIKKKCESADRNYPENTELIINDDGEVMLKKKKST